MIGFMMKRLLSVAALMTAFTALSAQAAVYELRTYTTHEGKLPNLLARFKDHTTALFEKHGMVNIGYWVPQDEPAKKNTLIYVLKHESKAAADKSWADFGKDPVWVKARTESEKDGKIVLKVDRVYMDATDFSKLK
jgi:hypothetical protein